MNQKLIDISVEHGLTQVHLQPTREGNILDLVFTNNTSLIKSSNSIPGFSDHAMVVTDSNVKPFYNKEKPRKIYMYSKADWNTINNECENLSDEIINLSSVNTNIQILWDKLKIGIQSIMDKNIPSKLFKKHNWPTIDVTRKSVEETAASILKIFEIKKNS